jgi:hypothetical protein
MKAAYPRLPETHIYDILSINGLPKRLKAELRDRKLPLDTAIEVGREISGDDRMVQKYMEHLGQIKRRKPNASIDPRDYRLALESLLNPSYDSIRRRLDALLLRLG